MLSVDALSKNFINVSITNTVDEALDILNQFKIKHLPIVKSKAFLTIISEETLKAAHPGTIMKDFVNKGVKKFVRQDDHLLDAAKAMVDEELTIIPVLEDDESFMGIITMEDLFTKIISRFGLNSDGSLLVIEVPQQDFQLSELIRILEMENVHLFSVLVSMENFPNIEITLKTDIKDINSVLQTLERYSYTVKAYFENDQYIHQLKDRYESLISYLNV
ncbi:CBS domain-containing protein [Membranihabitans maritimus]|uniref:CBS domain-containing protein n=1 Tax=Membranihabitans maritimus TaxID=2904244 RepID=UPI001F3FCB70|nr:CBS domain-containing protein [Membranihabitans maritimus]